MNGNNVMNDTVARKTCQAPTVFIAPAP